jgi:4-aminobutyrate aminotransferase-like enzyme
VTAGTIDLLRSYLEDPASGWADIGAVIIEPVQGNGGMIPAPAGFLTELRAVTADHGIKLIVDEVMSGFHRTGRPFAYQHDRDVRPDLIVVGKSVSAGLPLSGCLVAEEIAAANPSGVESSTYAGNLVSCAAALAAVDVYEEEAMSERAARLGELLVDALRDQLGDHDNVGEVRGRGLMIGVELVGDRASRTPLERARAVSEACLRRSMLVYPGGHHANVVGLLPPLVATEAQLHIAADRLGDAVREVTGG